MSDSYFPNPQVVMPKNFMTAIADKGYVYNKNSFCNIPHFLSIFDNYVPKLDTKRDIKAIHDFCRYAMRINLASMKEDLEQDKEISNSHIDFFINTVIKIKDIVSSFSIEDFFSQESTQELVTKLDIMLIKLAANYNLLDKNLDKDNKYLLNLDSLKNLSLDESYNCGKVTSIVESILKYDDRFVSPKIYSAVREYCSDIELATIVKLFADNIRFELDLSSNYEVRASDILDLKGNEYYKKLLDKLVNTIIKKDSKLTAELLIHLLEQSEYCMYNTYLIFYSIFRSIQNSPKKIDELHQELLKSKDKLLNKNNIFLNVLLLSLTENFSKVSLPLIQIVNEVIDNKIVQKFHSGTYGRLTTKLVDMITTDEDGVVGSKHSQILHSYFKSIFSYQSDKPDMVELFFNLLQDTEYNYKIIEYLSYYDEIFCSGINSEDFSYLYSTLKERIEFINGLYDKVYNYYGGSSNIPDKFLNLYIEFNRNRPNFEEKYYNEYLSNNKFNFAIAIVALGYIFKNRIYNALAGSKKYLDNDDLSLIIALDIVARDKSVSSKNSYIKWLSAEINKYVFSPDNNKLNSVISSNGIRFNNNFYHIPNEIINEIINKYQQAKKHIKLNEIKLARSSDISEVKEKIREISDEVIEALAAQEAKRMEQECQSKNILNSYKNESSKIPPKENIEESSIDESFKEQMKKANKILNF